MSETYNGGAKRSEKLSHFRLIPKSALDAEAKAFTEGYAKYCEGPLDSNWRRGNLEFFLDVYDHGINHIYSASEILHIYLLGARSAEEYAKIKPELIEHLGHARANMAMLIEWIENNEPYYQSHELTSTAEYAKIPDEGPAKEVTAEVVEPQNGFLAFLKNLKSK